ncbi:MAG: carbohydrate-binding protein [Bacteroidota bacterium]|nr:carbohydrate-binding protein [Bacteroidota bacterium]
MGSLHFKQHQKEHLNGQYTIIASYTDKGNNNIAPLTGHELVNLRNARVSTAFADVYKGFPRWRNSLGEGDHKSFVLLKDIDLSGIKKFTYEYASLNKDGVIEVRINSQEGPVISSVAYSATGSWDKRETVTGVLKTAVEGRNDLYFMVLKKEKPNDKIINLSHITFEK